jgi:ketosteroid isomerase-like protein
MLLFSLVGIASAKQQCAPPAKSEAEIVAVMKQMFVAARADDFPAVIAITTPDFYAYDNGKRFTAKSLMDLIKKAHADGQRYEWNVTEPEVHVTCNIAWVAYVNKGSFEDASGRKEMTWLESMVLDYADKQWRIRFLHSTRAAAAQ